MSRSLLGWALTSVIGLGVLVSCNTTKTPVTPPPPPCPFGIPQSVARACGTVAVPADYGRPQGATITLPYVVFRGSSAQASENATVALQGGPGASSTYIAYALRGWFERVKPLDDVIVFEQRGAGMSEPSLNCLLRPVLSVVDLNLFRKQAQACLDTYQAQGIELRDYNTRNSADDVAFLAAKLGYRKLNLYGLSYGTRLAQEVVRRHPGLVQAQILDGVIDPARPWAALQTRFLHDALQRFGQACVLAGRCPAGPDLPAQVQSAADTLDGLQLTVDGGLLGTSGPVVYSADALLFAVHSMGYSANRLAELPNMLAGIQARNVNTILNSARESGWLWHDLSLGMFLATACQDNPFDQATLQAAHAGLPPVFERRAVLYQALAEACAQAGLTPAADAQTPVTGQVPTLLITGRFDAVTPPEMAEAVARRFTPAQHVIFEAGGHVNAFNSECGALMVLSFLNNPARSLNTSCAATPLTWPTGIPTISP